MIREIEREGNRNRWHKPKHRKNVSLNQLKESARRLLAGRRLRTLREIVGDGSPEEKIPNGNGNHHKKDNDVVRFEFSVIQECFKGNRTTRNNENKSRPPSRTDKTISKKREGRSGYTKHQTTAPAPEFCE